MDLVAQVLRALEERPVNPEEFERCSCVLLQAQYPGLSAVEAATISGVTATSISRSVRVTRAVVAGFLPPPGSGREPA
jgi:hypothetical protein